MRKKILSLSISLCIVLLFTSCNQSTEITEKYVKSETGYALETFKGSSEQLNFTVKDEHEGIPITELAKFSLANAEYLEEINIGKNIKTIDQWALTNCNKLKAINVDSENQYFCSVDGALFTKDMKTLLCYPNNSHGVTIDKAGAYKSFSSYTIPDSVEKINNQSFYKCNALGEIKFNENLKEIGERAFTKCENLNNFELPNSLGKIGEDAFSFCNKLTKVYIPKTVTVIDDYAFFGANSVEKFEMERADKSGMTLSEKWLPEKQKSGSVINEKTPIEWNVGRNNQ